LARRFPFPLLSDAKLNVFKTYRAYDDFQSQPLHGTFLVDNDGLIRWVDIGPEPFTDPAFVLAESRRLLERVHVPPAEKAEGGHIEQPRKGG
jgi:alkyl hydroperoxide reductase subunit AhpC